MRIVRFLLLFTTILFIGCSKKVSPTITEAQVQIICKLSDNISLVGSPESLSVYDEGFTVISNPGKVLQFDFHGNQIGELGRSGNAKYEYNLPYVVRSYNDSIYIWSANSLKFIVYSMDGVPHSEYKYESAIRDFVPTDNKIFIYSSGTRDSYIIDVYSKKLESIVDTVGTSSDEHLTLLSRTSVAPIINADNHILFAPKDRMQVMKYDHMFNKVETLYDISSNTFVISNVNNAKSLLSNRNKRTDYLMNNSYTVCIICDGPNPKILAVEGKEEDDSINRRVSYDNRYYTLYDLKSGAPIAHYAYNSLGPQYLFSQHNGSLYFLKKIQDSVQEESYVLCKLIN